MKFKAAQKQRKPSLLKFDFCNLMQILMLQTKGIDENT